MIRLRHGLFALVLLASLFAMPAAAQADFGPVPGKTTMTALNRDGTLATQAGSHPYSFTVHFELNAKENGQTEGGEMRDLVINAPPGLVGNPEAVPSCPRRSFEGNLPNCPPGTQIGVVRATLPGFGQAFGPLYNLTPPPGTAAQFGFTAVGLTVLGSASVRTEDGYGISVSSPNTPLEVSAVTATLWGVPADPGHTPERGPEAVEGLESEAPLLPFLTLPTSCMAPPQLTVEVDSKLVPGVFVGGDEPVSLRDSGGNPLSLTGCDRIPFSPTISSSPTVATGDSASGLDFGLKLKGEGLLNPKDTAIAETEPMRTEVTFPVGIAANPAQANGLAACSLAQYRSITVQTPPGGGCPEASKIGTLVTKTPLLKEAIEGSVYLAAPRDNPFGSFLAIYIVAPVPERGVLIKQAGEVRADPVTGQLTTIVDGLPPLPYSSFEVKLREGPRAPLVTPALCGIYTTTAKLYPFSDPGEPVLATAPFTISAGAGGAGCAASEAQLPARPALEAGTTAPLAGAFSPFVFRVSRTDGEQRFSVLETTLPNGLTGRLAGIPYCPEGQIDAAKAREREGGGALELASPSCPATSRVGTVSVAAGAGPSPFYVQGTAYLAGPYKGAPFSLVVITPGVAGPFDLGAVVARAGVYIDETTAQVTIKSDPIPSILQGIPLDVRKIVVNTDRESFTLNPTNCDTKSLSGAMTMTTGVTASLRNRFQVGGCNHLDFSPKLTLSLAGATRRTGHPALKAVLTQPTGQANIARASAALPPTEFVDPFHVANPCTRPQFAEHRCPASSILGKARVFTPLLEKPLEGLVYFRANGGERPLPDVVADLNGQVHFVLVGHLDALHKKGSEASRVRTTFATVPDAPVTKAVIELKGGKKHGVLVNSANICKTPNKAIVKMMGQNGKADDSTPRVATSCGKK
jgi:hypothetical protein